MQRLVLDTPVIGYINLFWPSKGGGVQDNLCWEIVNSHINGEDATQAAKVEIYRWVEEPKAQLKAAP